MTVNMRDFLRSFGRIGLLSFGGPAAQISLMHDELVDQRKWLSEQQFLGALSFCMLLPGPEAMQLATYAGWRMRGIPGGLIAGLLFVVPGALVILSLALIYAWFGQVPLVQALFIGIKAAVVAIVIKALWSLSKKALKKSSHLMLAALAFCAMFFLSIPFPAIIFAAAFWGYISTHVTSDHAKTATIDIHWSQTCGTVVLWAAIWIAPIVVLWAMDATFLSSLALFFSKLAVVTFGGAYAVLAYMTQAVVETHGWLSTAQMIDALGLAETTPGPLILVTEFVGVLAGFKQDGIGLAVVAGILTLWVTFTPCFLWIFAGAPYVEWLLDQPRLKGALAGISAAVVGVILNLSVWFALHVVFADVTRGQFGAVPVWASFSPLAAGFVAFAALLLLVLKVPMMTCLAVLALASGGIHQLMP